jgi:ankyrin repeat protein
VAQPDLPKTKPLFSDDEDVAEPDSSSTKSLFSDEDVAELENPQNKHPRMFQISEAGDPEFNDEKGTESDSESNEEKETEAASEHSEDEDSATQTESGSIFQGVSREEWRSHLLRSISPLVDKRPVKAQETEKILDNLLKHGADVNARNSDGATALLLCCNYFAHAGLLLQHGADPKIAVNLFRLYTCKFL